MTQDPVRLRAAFDIEVTDDVAEAVEKALKDNRKIICDFLIDVVARNEDAVDSSKLKSRPIAGAAHMHDVSNGKCTHCDTYARAEVLYEV